MLTRLVDAAADDQSDMRPTVHETMRKVMMNCTTRKGVSVQEVIHLLLQMTSGDHDLELVRESSENISLELLEAVTNGSLVGRRNLQ